MSGNPLTNPAWASELADSVENLVGKVRTAATDNAVKASRGVVFGTLAIIAVVVAVPLALILLLGVVRELVAFATDHARAVWISYLAVGAVMLLAGFFALSKRATKEPA